MLIHAASDGRRTRVRLLLHGQDGTTGLNGATLDGHVEVVRLLLDSRADANKAGAVRPTTAHPPAIPGEADSRA